MGGLCVGLASQRVLVAGFVAPVAWLLAGCGSGGDLSRTVALPWQASVDYADGGQLPMTPEAERLAGSPDLTVAQQDYLTGLAEAGIHPVNTLRALGVGAYICQARAAGQSDQAVRELVAPMVRSDVIEEPATPGSGESVVDVTPVVNDVIRIATERLC